MDTAPKPITEIDQHSLDKEWINQPKKVERYARKITEAKFDLAEAKAELDAVKANLGFKIRNAPGKYNLPKVTDESVKSCILLQPKYKEALSRVHELQRTVDYLDGIMTALEHRKKALENLVYLHGQNYFSAPREQRKKP